MNLSLRKKTIFKAVKKAETMFAYSIFVIICVLTLHEIATLLKHKVKDLFINIFYLTIIKIFNLSLLRNRNKSLQILILLGVILLDINL